VGPDARLAAEDVVGIPPLRIAERARSVGSQGSPRSPLRKFIAPILFEDEWLIALDKPAGLAVHGGSGIARGLIEQLRGSRPQAPFLELVHRLDRDTSGVLLVAKKRSALTSLHAQLRQGEVDKRYLVLVRGRWRDAKRTVDVPLHKFSTRQGERRVRVEESGRHAVTVFRLEQLWSDHDPPLALLEAELKTGRTHQIRVHLTHLGHVLAGDDKYGDFSWNRKLASEGLKRMFLHARTLTFTHPASGKSLQMESPLPGDLRSFLQRLGESRRG
jgi:23S rRNA pseudouridine955/2504/2580 synthase